MTISFLPQRSLLPFMAAMLFASISAPVSAADPDQQRHPELAQARQDGPPVQETMGYLNARCFSRHYVLTPNGELFITSPGMGIPEHHWRVSLALVDLGSAHIISDSFAHRIEGGCVNNSVCSFRPGHPVRQKSRFMVFLLPRLRDDPRQLKKCMTAFKHLGKLHGAQDKELF